MYLEDNRRIEVWDALPGEDPPLLRAFHIHPIGYIERPHPFTTGTPPSRFIPELRRLIAFYLEHVNLFCGTFGLYTCSWCHRGLEGKPCHDMLLPGQGRLYRFHGGIEHYVLRHGYCPPEDFIEAVMHAPVNNPATYITSIHALAVAPPPGEAPPPALWICDDPNGRRHGRSSSDQQKPRLAYRTDDSKA
jgi:hypothetical protein